MCDGFMRTLRLYGKYVSVILQGTMQYKISFLLTALGRFLVAFNGVLAIFFLFSGFTDIKGYTYGEVLLCYALIQLSFYLAEMFGCGFAAFAGCVKRGDFDRMLVRPRSLILQVMGSRFDLGRGGMIFSALVMLAMGIRECRLDWTAARVVTMILMVLGGMFLFIGLFLVGATICFFSVEDSGAINVLTYGAREHGKYPIDVYGKDMMRFCTYIIPYTLVQYYPLQFLLGRTECWYYMFCPLGVGFFLLLAYGFWRFGVSRYASCGS